MKKVNYATLMLIFMVALIACKKNNDPSPEPVDPNNPDKGRFVLAVNPIASTAVADYLLTTTSLESGTLSTTGNGIEQDGTYRYYTTSGNKFFSMLYGQGNPGAVTVYDLNEQSKLNKLTNFQSETVQAFAPVNKDILMVKMGRSVTSPVSRWYRVSTESLVITGEGQFNALDLAGNGELAEFSWIQQVGNKVFAPYFCIKGTTDGGWTTSYPDSAWIAVFSYPEMQLEKIIRDNRTSSIGLYFQNGLTVVENGDTYAFSPSNTVGQSEGTQFFNSTKPSSVTRIKAGTTEFDQTYLFDVEAVSGGAYIAGWIYVGNNTVVAALNSKDKKSQWQGADRFAIINLESKSFKWVTGIPDAATIADFSMTNYSPGNGIAYLGITTTDNTSAVYKVDAGTATATRGLQVNGGIITAIQWVPYEN
ncbi:MAG: DUF4374 domain-containing protein [Chitinophagaceae bacterium]|nr:DUF4374 domain-containing protein [Chitinophagaceae bacterium]